MENSVYKRIGQYSLYDYHKSITIIVIGIIISAPLLLSSPSPSPWCFSSVSLLLPSLHGSSSLPTIWAFRVALHR